MSDLLREGLSRETFSERQERESRVRAEILSHPEWTLMRLGWVTPSGRVQGSIVYRIGEGLGPMSRDRTHRDVLNDEVRGSYMPHADQEWGIEVLATPCASAVTDRAARINAGKGWQ